MTVENFNPNINPDIEPAIVENFDPNLPENHTPLSYPLTAVVEGEE